MLSTKQWLKKDGSVKKKLEGILGLLGTYDIWIPEQHNAIIYGAMAGSAVNSVAIFPDAQY